MHGAGLGLEIDFVQVVQKNHVRAPSRSCRRTAVARTGVRGTWSSAFASVLSMNCANSFGMQPAPSTLWPWPGSTMWRPLGNAATARRRSARRDRIELAADREHRQVARQRRAEIVGALALRPDLALRGHHVDQRVAHHGVVVGRIALELEHVLGAADRQAHADGDRIAEVARQHARLRQQAFVAPCAAPCSTSGRVAAIDGW